MVSILDTTNAYSTPANALKYIFPPAIKSSKQISIEVINDSIMRRRQNRRDDIVQSLRAGRHLVSLKPTVPHGEWQAFVMENTEYKSTREYQTDMRFWEYWSPHINQLIEVGIITSIDTPEYQFVDTLEDNDIDICFSAMRKYIDGHVPDLALQVLFDRIKAGDTDVGTIKSSDRIIAAAKAVEVLPEPDHKLGEELVIKHGVTNPDVIAMTPLINEDQDIVDEIRSTGMMFVPAGNYGSGRQIPINEVSPTDVEIRVGRGLVEKELVGELVAGNRYQWIGNKEGTIEEIIQWLNSVPQDMRYKISLSYITGT